MSLAIVIKAPEGIVLAAESRVSYQIPDGTGANNWVTFDNATKLLAFDGHDYVGAVTFGAGNIGDRTAHSFLPELLTQLGDKRLSIAAFAKKMSDFFLAQWKEAMPEDYDGQPMIFAVAGFNEKSPYATVMQFAIPGAPQPELAIAEDSFNTVWGGDRGIVDRLMSGLDVRADNFVETLKLSGDDKKRYEVMKQEVALPLVVNALALQDAVNLALTLINTTIELQSLSVGQRTVGGPIDIATITREDNLRFVQKKEIQGAKQ
jgi:hypothetical protein